EVEPQHLLHPTRLAGGTAPAAIRRRAEVSHPSEPQVADAGPVSFGCRAHVVGGCAGAQEWGPDPLRLVFADIRRLPRGRAGYAQEVERPHNLPSLRGPPGHHPPTLRSSDRSPHYGAIRHTAPGEHRT